MAAITIYSDLCKHKNLSYSFDSNIKSFFFFNIKLHPYEEVVVSEGRPIGGVLLIVSPPHLPHAQLLIIRLLVCHFAMEWALEFSI